jgi:hypothetical protein
MRTAEILGRVCRLGAMLGIAAICGIVSPAGLLYAEPSGPPPSEARIWIYRVDNPYTTLSTPEVRINGAIVAPAALGSRFYRDVPAGNYLITAESAGAAPGQFARVALAAGETVYVKVDADNWWASANCDTAVVTFYTLVVDPRLARLEMAGLPVGG